MGKAKEGRTRFQAAPTELSGQVQTGYADGHTGKARRAFATEAVHSSRKPQHTDNAERQAGRSIGATREVFLRGVALLPSLIQGVESIYGAKTGAQKKSAALDVVSSAIKMTDAIASKTIADGDKFASGLGLVIDGVVACLNASIWAK